MSNLVAREWQVPRADTPMGYRVGWINECCEQGAAYNENQRGFRDWRKGLEIIAGTEGSSGRLDYRSCMSSGRLKTNVKIMIAGLANIRPFWGYHAAPAFVDYAEMLNKTARALYLEGFWDQAVKSALAWSAVTCTGWIRPVYRRDLNSGRGKIELDTFGQPCVLPVQLPSDGNYQRAYAVTLMDEMPIYMAHAMWSDWQDVLKPTSAKYWYSAEIREAARDNKARRIWNWFRPKTQKDNQSDLYIPIRHTRVIDLSLNETGSTISMGQPGSSWYYEVPAYGTEITAPDGSRRRANEVDARLYPNGRRLISSEQVIMYDGPDFNWHGELDLIPFTVDKWPWEPSGLSLVHDGYALQQARDVIDRGIMTKVNAQLDLPLTYPIDGVNANEAEGFDPMQPRSRVGYDQNMVEGGKPFGLAVPWEVYQVHPEEMEWGNHLDEQIDYLCQTRDIVELGKARALDKGMDNIEALLAANGPIVKDMSRAMEDSLGQMGRQVGWLILQYETTARLMQYNGSETLPPSVFDYNPASIIPSHLPDENPHDPITQEALPSRYSQLERAKWFAGNIRFFIMPHSVHEITQMTYKLGLMQLRSRGAPISWATVMNSWEVANVGDPSGVTEQERFWSEKEEEITHAARMQEIVMNLGIDHHLMPGGGAPGDAARANGSTPQGGRPSTDAQPPQLKQKGDGRPVVSSSG